MIKALDRGESLILFPEGTRGTGEDLQPFKCGIFHLNAVSQQEAPLKLPCGYAAVQKLAVWIVLLLASDDEL